MWRMLRTNADLRALFVAQVVSFMGDWFTFVALAGLIKEATGSADKGLLVLAPLSLIAGLMVFMGGHDSKIEFAGAAFLK